MHSDRQEARAFELAALCFDEKNWSKKLELAPNTQKART
jgi:hypothetical protein